MCYKVCQLDLSEGFTGPVPVWGHLQDWMSQKRQKLECVDYVFIFDDERLDDILLYLKPHVQAKGTDYTPETVPESRTVASYGGKVVICGDPKDRSTTEILLRIKDSA